MFIIREITLSLVLMLALTAAVSTTPAPARAEEYVPYKTMWVAKRANVRAGPSTTFLKTDLLEVGERVTVVAKTGDWFQLSPRAGQPRRFVYAPLLTESKPAGSTTSTSTTIELTPTVKTMAYDGGQYRGPTRNGRPHGHGVLTWPDGKRYQGGFVNGERTGHGVYSLLSGDHYEGDFVNGRFHGRGVMVYEGRRYEGGWRDNRQQGRGVYTWPSGARYEGDFRDGKEHGHGIYTWSSGRRYEGEFVDGEITGRGVYSSVDVEIHIEEQARQHNNEEARNGSQAQNREYWGAFISTIGLRRPAYGISWNYPSKEEALNRAARECGERAGYENGVCDIASELDDKFSTFAPYEDDYNFRMRCYAVALYTSAQDQTGFYAGAAGNSESDAMARVRADSVVWGYSANIAQVVCNAK